MSNFQLPAGLRPSAPPSGSSSSPQPQQPSPDEQAAARERAAAQEDMKRNMISAMLEPAARERLSRISLTRPQLAAQVQDLLVRMGTQGQIKGQVSDEALKGLLEQVSNPPAAKPATQTAPTSARTRTLAGGITIQRKHDDSDSDEYDL